MDLGSRSLDEILEWIWAEWSSAVADREHPFRLPVVATTSVELGPQARTVVLRAVDRSQRTLEFHTDRRSPKRAELESDARLAWHFWDPDRQVQIRVRSRARLHLDDAYADRRYGECPPSSRVIYLVGDPPGSVLDEPLPGPDPTDEVIAAGRANFAVVVAEVEQIDFYEIAHPYPRRGWFVSTPVGWEKTWRTP